MLKESISQLLSNYKANTRIFLMPSIYNHSLNYIGFIRLNCIAQNIIENNFRSNLNFFLI